jgi:uncharacterized membrane protein YfcA
MRRSTLMLAALVTLVFTTEAHAYIDPAAGSFLLQIIMGGLVSAYVGVKLFKRRVIEFFRRQRP